MNRYHLGFYLHSYWFYGSSDNHGVTDKKIFKTLLANDKRVKK